MPKSAERTPQRTIYLWSCELHRATEAATNELIASLLRLQLRLSAERSRTLQSLPTAAQASTALGAGGGAAGGSAEHGLGARADPSVIRCAAARARRRALAPARAAARAPPPFTAVPSSSRPPPRCVAALPRLRPAAAAVPRCGAAVPAVRSERRLQALEGALADIYEALLVFTEF